MELEKLKSMIIQEVECSDQEDKNIQDYKKEMDSLVQEKMAHVEELRQIHADINAVSKIFAFFKLVIPCNQLLSKLPVALCSIDLTQMVRWRRSKKELRSS